jgi:UDPglucose--hexose-1-phosphate uridylyltransferase
VKNPGRISDLAHTPHRRFNPLTREWVLVSPHRALRPWQGKVADPTPAPAQHYDPHCYLCPGNERAATASHAHAAISQHSASQQTAPRNPPYSSTFVFDNDYASLLPNTPPIAINEADLFVARSEAGICRVVCFSPRHDLTIPRMSQPELRIVVDSWAEQYASLAALDWVNHVQIFENRGQLMGASNPHPHCQIWANATIPNIAERELASLAEYHAKKISCLLCDYLALEEKRQERIVCQNDSFLAVVPYWAVWPFETLLLSKRHLSSIDQLSSLERDHLADILRLLTTHYDNLFQTSFPYSMGFHQRPTDGHPHPECHFHAHYFPPLLRSANIQKFMVGYELLASPQRDITPESAAEQLRNAGEIHYLDAETHRALISQNSNQEFLG